MQRLFRLLRVASALALAPASLVAQGAIDHTPTIIKGPVAHAVDSTLHALESTGFSGAVMVVDHGTVILKNGYGLANRAAGTKMTGNTIMPIGSNTKDFTNVALLQLEERGRIHFSDSISKYFKGVPADKQGITLQMLVNHRAGFEQHLGGDYEAIGRADEIRRALSSHLLFTPGSQEHYSNIGFSLLAAIIEQVSGKTYEEYVRDEILKPIGLTETGTRLPKFDHARLSHGYADGVDRGSIYDHALAPDGTWWNLRGNGGIQSTMDDMYAFYRELFSGATLMKPATRALHFNADEPNMMAGSDLVNYFMYGREPQQGLEFFLFTNATDFPAPRAIGPLTAALGVGGRGGPGAPAGGAPAGGAPAGGAPAGGAPGAGGRGAPGGTIVVGGPGGGRGGPGGPGAPPATPAVRRARAYFDAYLNRDTAEFHRFITANVAPDVATPAVVTSMLADFLRDYERYGFLAGINMETTSPTRVISHRNSAMRGPVALIVETEASEPYRITSLKFDESAPAAPVVSPAAATVPIAFPDSPTGRTAAQYLRSHNSGDAAQMRTFIEQSAVPDPARPIDARIDGYRRMFDNLGTLTPIAIDAASATEITVRIRASKTGEELSAVFSFESVAPYRLTGVRLNSR